MSAVQNVGSSNLAALQQRLQRGAQPAPFQGPPPQVQGRFQSLAESAGLDSSQLGDIKEQMRAAVENARGNDGSIDRAALKETVSGILKDNGIDPEQLRAKLQGMFQQAGFSPAARPKGSPVGGEFGTARQVLLNELNADEGAEATSGNTVSLLQLLENLPKGSLVNTAA